MTRRYKSVRQQHPLRGASPEQLLLLTIFGNECLRRHVESELDRRALVRRARETEFRSQGGGNRAA
jgi:hypothetical protein